MRIAPNRTILFLCLLAANPVHAAQSLLLPDGVAVGRNLEGFTNIRMSQPAPKLGLEVTLTSDQPKQFLFALTPDAPGSKSITVKVKEGYSQTPDFYFQALADTGTATYTVAASGFETAKGIVALRPSTITINGPFSGPMLRTTPATPGGVTLRTAMIDASEELLEQPVAGGLKFSVEVGSSNPAVGAIANGPLTLVAGASKVKGVFKPAGVGETTLALKLPPGFTARRESASVKVIVDAPGIGITGEINIGKDLQAQGFVLLGDPAPPGGLDVRLTSEDQSRLILSKQAHEVGAGSVTIHFAPGEVRASYSIQALADSGTVNYTATAPGYRKRSVPVSLRPSGVMVVYSPYGPPDEAEYLRILPPSGDRPFTASLAEQKPVPLTLWTTYLLSFIK